MRILPGYPATRLPGYPATRLPGYPAFVLPKFRPFGQWAVEAQAGSKAR